ncbi:hypothetical protein PCL_04374 [Purpureocillium lilacinum]|uniref:Uncharacterized protein n=1 Tax=Purpureocillium lilacinum TaxID=33203 RepID=A0A2U3DY94_PURLI|nr:hypothetical protein Purlil1_5339 [Purpureocillium lilacinum]PWI67212.1 hypothetical protein PCL_04374 [Purpureocillium lilacinum]
MGTRPELEAMVSRRTCLCQKSRNVVFHAASKLESVGTGLAPHPWIGFQALSGALGLALNNAEKAINMHLQMVDVWWTLRPGYVIANASTNGPRFRQQHGWRRRYVQHRGEPRGYGGTFSVLATLRRSRLPDGCSQGLIAMPHHLLELAQAKPVLSATRERGARNMDRCWGSPALEVPAWLKKLRAGSGSGRASVMWQAAIRATRATFPTVAPCGGRAASCGASHRLHGSPPPPKKMDGRLPRCPAQSPPAVPRWRSQLGVRPASGAEPRGTEYDGSPRSGTASVRTPPLVFLLLLTAPAEQDDSVGDPRDNPRRLSTPSRGRQWTSVGSANSSAQKCPANVHPELNVTLFFCFRSQAAYIARPSAVLVPHSSSSTVSCAPLHVQRDCDGHRSNHVARRFAEPGY